MTAPETRTGWNSSWKERPATAMVSAPRIKVTAGGKVQYSHVSFAAGYASSSAAPTHFGLGPAASASLVEIRWPSGV